MAIKIPRRGELYWVQLDPVIGAEIAKTRPAVVISNDVGNEYSARVIVAPLSSSVAKVYPFESHLPSGEGGLTQDSKVLLDQIRSVDKSRLGKKIGTLTAARMADVERALKISLGLT